MTIAPFYCKIEGLNNIRIKDRFMKKRFLCALVLLVLSITGLCSCSTSENEIKIIDVALTEEEYAFVAKKGNIALTSDFNSYLEEIKENGTFAELVSKYFEGEGERRGFDVTTTDVENTPDTLVVVTNCPFEPFEFIGTDGRIYGFDIEIAAGYAESRGLSLVIKNIGFDDIFTQIDAGYADIGMAGITVNSDRAMLYDFTNTYYNASQKLIVLGSNTDFDGCDDAVGVDAVLASLGGEKIGYQNGTTGGMYINGDADWGYDGFPDIEGKGYATALDAIVDLMNGNLYAVIIDEAPANALMRSTSSDWGVKLEKFLETMESEYFRELLISGLINTVKVAVLGLIIGIIIGTLIAIVKVAPKYSLSVRILDKLCSVYVAVFRGTPMVVQLLLAYYVFLPALGVRNVDSLIVGIVVFGMNSGAYVSEIMRGGLNSVDSGQMEAGRAVGLSYKTAMLRIIIPQAVKNILPTLGNEFITLIKETSVLSFITVYDLYTALSTIGSKNYEKMIPYIVMAFIYIAMVMIITLMIKLIERSFAKSDRARASQKNRKGRA